MPRISRKYLETDIVHVIVQGIDREYIFKDNYLKTIYFNFLKEKFSKTDIKIIAYCIMDNHAHILVKMDKIAELSKVMQKINTKYGMKYNALYNRVGYVFRNRYYTQPILTQEQLYNCIVYIHNNPVKAKIVKNMGSYKYSSYLEYIEKRDLISKDEMMLIFENKEQFLEVHKKVQIDDIAEIIETYINHRDIIEKYKDKNKMSLEEIKKNEEIFSNLLMELRHRSGISLRKMAGIFGINKDRLNKIINISLKNT